MHDAGDASVLGCFHLHITSKLPVLSFQIGELQHDLDRLISVIRKRRIATNPIHHRALAPAVKRFTSRDREGVIRQAKRVIHGVNKSE